MTRSVSPQACGTSLRRGVENVEPINRYITADAGKASELRSRAMSPPRVNALASDGSFRTNTLGADGIDNGNTTRLSIGDESTRVRRVDDRDTWFVMRGKRPCWDARMQERARKKLIHVAVILSGTSATVGPKCRSPM